MRLVRTFSSELRPIARGTPALVNSALADRQQNITALLPGGRRGTVAFAHARLRQ